jgi:hypothetical protein
LQNSQKWEITQHTVDTENQQFFSIQKVMNVHVNMLNYLWSLLWAPKAHLTKTTTKFVNKKNYTFMKW